MTPEEDRDPVHEAGMLDYSARNGSVAMSAPVFFSELCDAAVSGKSLDDALDALGKLILEATADKEAGYGPPQSELNAARRKWLDMYEQQRKAA